MVEPATIAHGEPPKTRSLQSLVIGDAKLIDRSGADDELEGRREQCSYSTMPLIDPPRRRTGAGASVPVELVSRGLAPVPSM